MPNDAMLLLFAPRFEGVVVFGLPVAAVDSELDDLEAGAVGLDGGGVGAGDHVGVVLESTAAEGAEDQTVHAVGGGHVEDVLCPLKMEVVERLLRDLHRVVGVRVVVITGLLP